MFYSILFTVLALAGTAEKMKVIDSSCAKVALSAIYAGEKSYYSEYNHYSDSLEKIGYQPEVGACNDWKSTVRVFQGGQEFLAESTHKNGERWVINHMKELRKE
jgi:hypothetical protein